jgi:hypothetical protein
MAPGAVPIALGAVPVRHGYRRRLAQMQMPPSPNGNSGFTMVPYPIREHALLEGARPGPCYHPGPCSHPGQSVAGRAPLPAPPPPPSPHVNPSTQVLLGMARQL